MMKSGQDMMEESLPEGSSSALVGAVASAMVCGEVPIRYQIVRFTPTGLPVRVLRSTYGTRGVNSVRIANILC